MGYFIGLKAADDLDRIVEGLREVIPDCEQQQLHGMRGQAHITIAHLGRQFPDLSTFEAMAKTCSPFEISLGGVEIFRNSATTHLVLPVSMGRREMKRLHAKLQKPGKSIPRVFNAHITVATVPSSDGDSPSYLQMLGFRDRFGGRTWGNMVVDSICLFTSRRGVVRVMDRWRLSGTDEVM